MDKFGRKRTIIGKIVLCALSLAALIPLGLINSVPASAVFFFYFFALLSASFTFDLILFGFEQIPKNGRDNYVITLAATRVLGVALVGLSFYLMTKWVYFIILEIALMVILLSLFIKFTFESPLQIMVSSGNHDMCKFVLNSIAIINEEEIIREKLAFSQT